jgi:hypothetical protein
MGCNLVRSGAPTARTSRQRWTVRWDLDARSLPASAAGAGAAGPRGRVQGRGLGPRCRGCPRRLQTGAAAALHAAEAATLQLPLAVARLVARPALQLIVFQFRQ